MVKHYIPEKGDIVHFDFDPSVGHEQKGKRFAVVVSHYLFNKSTGMCYALPITSKCKGYPSQIKIKQGRIDGCVLVDQLKSVDYRARNIEFVAKLNQADLQNILDLIETIIFSQ